MRRRRRARDRTPRIFLRVASCGQRTTRRGGGRKRRLLESRAISALSIQFLTMADEAERRQIWGGEASGLGR